MPEGGCINTRSRYNKKSHENASARINIEGLAWWVGRTEEKKCLYELDGEVGSGIGVAVFHLDTRGVYVYPET